MRKILPVLLISFFSAFAAQAQRSSFSEKDHPALERIHAAQMAYLTDRLHLSVDQAGAFTPLYNEYEKESMDIRMSFRKKYMDDHPGDDRMTRKHAIDNDLDYQQQILDLKRKYNDRFAKVIAPAKVSDLYEAEREFKEKLKQRLNQQDHSRRRW